MSTGISISSINRIKELAEEKRFAEALEILDTQNLDKSINPQFLRISGEIFRENKRYYDCRRILLKAHQMSPQGTRIIFELIQLYLELGYYSKAAQYYEQYQFYSTSEDTQREYVEYIMKKATGADVKELATILIPILERMPEDRWNFEAVLLYHQMDRKDKALEESRYILENFKNSIYVQPVIQYIDDKLDVDQYFYVYPKEEQEEDVELFGDLIEQEKQILEADHLRMFPPEARIMVEAEDKDIDTIPVKEKKTRKKRRKKDDSVVVKNDDKQTIEKEETNKTEEPIVQSEQAKVQDALVDGDASDKQSEAIAAEEEKKKQEERTAALEKLLSKKIDADKIKESAKQVAKAVKEIDTEKAKSQVKNVAGTVKDSMKKATDAFSEAVGTEQAKADISEHVTDQIVDGIIESVLEPPKKTVGQVITDEELDAILPDSLEAISEQERADIIAKQEEAERLELEALEASLKLEEERKSKRMHSSILKSDKQELSEEEVSEVNAQVEEMASVQDNLDENSDVGEDVAQADASTYAELKKRYLQENANKEKPLESLGFISVVHADVDQTIEETIPDAAEMLHQMIDNKEFYTDENSTGFESQASYHNHGFEVEDYDFDSYKHDEAIVSDESDSKEWDALSVEEIYAKEQVVSFEEIMPEENLNVSEEAVIMPSQNVQAEEPEWTAPVVAEEEQTIEPEWTVPVAEEEEQTTEPEWTVPVAEEEEQTTEPEWTVPVAEEEEQTTEPEWTASVVAEEEQTIEPEWTAPVVEEEEQTTEPEWTAPVVEEEEQTAEPEWTVPVAEEEEQTIEPEWTVPVAAEEEQTAEPEWTAPVEEEYTIEPEWATVVEEEQNVLSDTEQQESSMQSWDKELIREMMRIGIEISVEMKSKLQYLKESR